MKTINLFMALVLVAGLALVVGPVPVAQAADIGVDCTTAALIAAINTANSNGEPDTLKLAAGCTYTLTEVDKDTDGANGLPSITSEIIINGNGAIIERSSANGTPDFRIFHVAAEGNLTLNDLTVRNGSFARFPDYYGGGIFNAGTLTLTNSIVSGNSAGINGGGIFNDDGALTLTNSDVSDNQARGAETHEGGGGIFNDRGTVELIDSTVSGNSASIDGSGIFNDDGALTLTNSTVSGNSGAKDGGGIYNNTGTVELINSTVSGNSVGTDGGGICNAFGGTVTLTNSTISDNEAWYGGGIYNGGLGVVELANTIVAANPRGGDCCSGGTCSGPGIISLGHNLDSDGTCNLNPALGDLPNRDPRLGPLADNGGRTWTHALLPGSPAIDAGDDSACPATDQRGVIRPLDGDGDGTATCDIGAYEFEPPTIMVPIDIKPGSDPNSINCNNKNGVIPVAILTTEDFEARTVDHTTVTFEGASEMHVDKKSGEPRRHEEDVDGDGDIDLVFHFRLGDTGLTCDSTEGTLTGETFDSRVIVGSDAVRMIDRGGGKP